MMRRTVPVVLLCSALLAAAPAWALAKGPLPEPDVGPDPRGLTLSGTGVVRVQVPKRVTVGSVEDAVQASRPKALKRALEQARGRARRLAAAARLSLGDVQAVTERDLESEFGFVPAPRPGCRVPPGTAPRGSARLRCLLPSFTVVSVVATFATAETSAAAAAGRAIVASGRASAPVRPHSRRSSASIRDALFAARLAAAPGALIAARRSAQAVGRAAALQPGGLFSIAEVSQRYDDVIFGSFGPARFCGTVRRPIFRRDPATGRRRVVRRVRQRRCFHPPSATVALRVTILPG